MAVCEKGRVGHEQSGRNWGWVRVMGREISEIPMALESQRLWEGMDKRVGADLGFRRSGIVYVSDTEEAFAKQAECLNRARDYQLGSRLLSAPESKRCCPVRPAAMPGLVHAE